jgi:DeoR family glycerol-3-phosphate regulon repressor
MTQAFRLAEILAIARAEGRVAVDDLARRLGVTAQTIRRDLADLAGAGRLERVHGGAVLPSGTANLAWEERRRRNAAAKAAIGAACAAEVPDGASLFLNIGTTTEAVARALAERRGLLVVTNNLNAAAILGGLPETRVIVTGGRLRPEDGGLVGALAAETVRRFRLDLGVIGCSAIDPSGELLDYDSEEVEVSRAILERARRRVLVADAAKLARSAPVRIAALSDLDLVVTDRPLPAPLTALCDRAGTAMRVAAPAGQAGQLA